MCRWLTLPLGLSRLVVDPTLNARDRLSVSADPWPMVAFESTRASTFLVGPPFVAPAAFLPALLFLGLGLGLGLDLGLDLGLGLAGPLAVVNGATAADAAAAEALADEKEDIEEDDNEEEEASSAEGRTICSRPEEKDEMPPPNRRAREGHVQRRVGR